MECWGYTSKHDLIPHRAYFIQSNCLTCQTKSCSDARQTCKSKAIATLKMRLFFCQKSMGSGLCCTCMDSQDLQGLRWRDLLLISVLEWFAGPLLESMSGWRLRMLDFQATSSCQSYTKCMGKAATNSWKPLSPYCPAGEVYSNLRECLYIARHLHQEIQNLATTGRKIVVKEAS